MEYENNDPKYGNELINLDKIINDFMFFLRFVGMDASRGGDEWKNNLLSFTAHDIIESSFGVIALAKEGLSTTCRRELRFLIELAIKVCYIEQEFSTLELKDKLERSAKLLDSPNIGIKKDINFHLIPDCLHSPFREELGRLYGKGSEWVHLSSIQLTDRIERIKRGVTAGREGLKELTELVTLAERVFAAIIVLILHTVPQWVAGDLLVTADGKTHESHFEASRFVAAIDSHFDYKYERQQILSHIHKRRAELQRF